MPPADLRELVEEQTPNRLARKCDVCGAGPGHPCLDITAGHPLNQIAERLFVMTIPHHARLVGHAAPGPLFEAR